MSAGRESVPDSGEAPAAICQPYMAPLCDQIAMLAANLVDQLETAAGNYDEMRGAHAIAAQIGMLADVALRNMGAPVMRGDAMDWLSYPNVIKGLKGAG